MRRVANESSRSTVWQGGCLLLVIVGILATLGGLIWLFFREAPLPNAPLPTAVLHTATPTPIPTATPTPTPAPLPTPQSDVSIGIGSRVQVSGTGGAGLSLRSGPGLSNERLSVAGEGEIFVVAAGPNESDGLLWWLLKYEGDPAREGWAADNYLVPVR
jgi:hypothetical protein